jgi:membrane-associated phospholipid phosphatase
MLGIWFTAVYSAHHYIIDAILGAGCALLGIFLFEKVLLRWKPFSRFIDRYTAYVS